MVGKDYEKSFPIHYIIKNAVRNLAQPMIFSRLQLKEQDIMIVVIIRF